MKKRLAITLFALVAPFLFADCTPMITDEQKLMLQELRRKESSLNDEISKINSMNLKYESEIKGIQSQADDCNKKRQFVEDKLKNWPNVWP